MIARSPRPPQLPKDLAAVRSIAKLGDAIDEQETTTVDPKAPGMSQTAASGVVLGVVPSSREDGIRILVGGRPLPPRPEARFTPAMKRPPNAIGVRLRVGSRPLPPRPRAPLTAGTALVANPSIPPVPASHEVEITTMGEEIERLDTVDLEEVVPLPASTEPRSAPVASGAFDETAHDVWATSPRILTFVRALSFFVFYVTIAGFRWLLEGLPRARVLATEMYGRVRVEWSRSSERARSVDRG